jgi:hypothetical protein
VTTGESVRPQEVSLQAPLREQPVSQQEEPPPATRPEPPLRGAWEQSQVQRQAHFALEQREPPREPQVLQPMERQPAARLAQPQEQQVSQPH